MFNLYFLFDMGQLTLRDNIIHPYNKDRFGTKLKINWRIMKLKEFVYIDWERKIYFCLKYWGKAIILVYLMNKQSCRFHKPNWNNLTNQMKNRFHKLTLQQWINSLCNFLISSLIKYLSIIIYTFFIFSAPLVWCAVNRCY